MKFYKFISDKVLIPKIISIFLVCFLFQNLSAQVTSRVLGPDQTIQEIIPWYFDSQPDKRMIPRIDVQETLKKDRANQKKQPTRVAIRGAIDLAKSDGTYYEFDNYDVWKMVVSSKGAKTLGLTLGEVVLPADATMYVYNPDKKFVYGPVTSKDFYQGVLNTELIAGDYAIIDVYLPKGNKSNFKIKVLDGLHGIQPYMFDPSFGASQACNVNTICPQGNGWGNEIDAVCKILTGGGGSCTGTLVNNACNDLTPYILTAAHCAGTGSAFASYLFRFNYESLSCTTDNEPGPSSWITFSGSVLRARWTTTDFALLEMTTAVGSANVSFAGWNRSASPATNTLRAISHPAGDVKKISRNNDGALSQTNFWNVVQWDQGLVEPGSSGCGLFDTNRRIIGSLSGGDANIGCTGGGGLVDNTIFGKFNRSWTGGGTAASRLSDWLGGNNNPTTLNGIQAPEIAGHDFVCSSSKSFVLQNVPPGYSVTWSVSPTFLFGSSTSGNGNTANLWAASFNSRGAATITFTIVNNCGGTSITLTDDFWVGRPRRPSIQTPTCFNPNTNVPISAFTAGATSISWSFPNCPFGFPSGDPTPGCWFNYTGNLPNIMVYVGDQGGSISFFATNVCGTSSINKPITFCNDPGPGPGPGGGPIIRSHQNSNDKTSITTTDFGGFNVFPNPAKDFINVQLDNEYYSNTNEKIVQIVDLLGITHYTTTTRENLLEINTADLVPGNYVVLINYNGEFATQSIIVQ